VLPRWQAGFATAAVTALAVALVILDSTDRGARRFWATHALTTDTVAGLMVLGLTVLVVDQVLTRRDVAARSRVVAAQAGFVLGQARRCVQAVRPLQSGGGDRDAAINESRSYSLMLMLAAPVLVDSPVARAFLDEAQRLAGEVARILVPSAQVGPSRSDYPGGLDEAITHLRAAAAPLMDVLTPSERSVVQGGSSS
jgi:hypothetical protein